VQGQLLEGIYESLIWSVHRLHEEAGLLHRDVCPSNILIHGEGDRVRLTLIDCAFAWPLDEPGQIPVRNDNYTAPEQLAGRAGPSSDWYSVASTCYFLANGVPPDPKDEAAFALGLERLGSGFIKHAVESLLCADLDERPDEFWELLPRPTSQPVLFSDRQVVGALDLGSGAILMYSRGFGFVPQPALSAALAEHRTAGRIADAGLLRFLERLASRPA
jgi:serine/threonine protein kinase